MAKKASNSYLKSMCVRNAVLSAWTTLEMACCDALGINKLSSDFRQSLDDQFDKKGIARLDFGSGVWGKIASKIKDARKLYAHRGVKLSDRFPPISVAVDAIQTIRDAIQDIYGRVGKASPAWVQADESSGWSQTGGSKMTANLTVLRQGADPGAPDTYKIVLVTPVGEEKPTDYFAGTAPLEDVYEEVEKTIGSLNVPFSGIRVYQGPTLIYSEDFEVRG
jgi:hypothetical protein